MVYRSCATNEAGLTSIQALYVRYYLMYSIFCPLQHLYSLFKMMLNLSLHACTCMYVQIDAHVEPIYAITHGGQERLSTLSC